MMFAGVPNLRWTIHHTLVEGGPVMGFSTCTGTHEGEFMGIPATGPTVTIEAWRIDRYPRRHLRREPHHDGHGRPAPPARRPAGLRSRLTATAEQASSEPGVSEAAGRQLSARVFDTSPHEVGMPVGFGASAQGACRPPPQQLGASATSGTRTP